VLAIWVSMPHTVSAALSEFAAITFATRSRQVTAAQSQRARRVRATRPTSATKAHGTKTITIQGFAGMTALQYVPRGVPGSGTMTGGGGCKQP
jgi:hypothetical protein